MPAEEAHDAGVPVADDDGDQQQHDAHARRHDPRQHVLALVLHGAVQQRDAAHQVDRSQNRACVQKYHSNWKQHKTLSVTKWNLSNS